MTDDTPEAAPRAVPDRVECPMCYHQFDPVRNPVNAT